MTVIPQRLVLGARHISRTDLRIDDLVSVGTGNYTLDPADGSYLKLANNGGLTLTAPTALDNDRATTVTIYVSNTAVSSTVTWSGWTTGTPKGNTVPSGNGDEYLIHCDIVKDGTTVYATATVLDLTA